MSPWSKRCRPSGQKPPSGGQRASMGCRGSQGPHGPGDGGGTEPSHLRSQAQGQQETQAGRTWRHSDSWHSGGADLGDEPGPPALTLGASWPLGAHGVREPFSLRKPWLFLVYAVPQFPISTWGCGPKSTRRVPSSEKAAVPDPTEGGGRGEWASPPTGPGCTPSACAALHPAGGTKQGCTENGEGIHTFGSSGHSVG